jgi:6-phosphogluconolactonase
MTMSYAEEKLRVYIGTYTGKESKGIYVCELDLATGKLTEPKLAAEAQNPTFLALHPNGKVIYGANEISNFQGKKSGAVGAFSIDAATGLLTLLNVEPNNGNGPCHVSVTPDGKYVLAASYGAGNVCAFPVLEGGKLGALTGFVQHEGTCGPNKQRQERTHAHSINPDASGRLAFAADLGLDKILIYDLDPAKGTLTPHDPPHATVAPGAGPRHFTFHPNGRFAYVINELLSTVTAFSYDAQKGLLTELQTISTLPADFTGKNTTAEVVVHPSGRTLYGSNRGHDSIAIFTLDDKTGKLTATGYQATGGKAPRNFNVTPDGKWLLAANQDTNNVNVFKVDPQTGALTPTENTISVGRPVRVLFVKP